MKYFKLITHLDTVISPKVIEKDRPMENKQFLWIEEISFAPYCSTIHPLNRFVAKDVAKLCSQKLQLPKSFVKYCFDKLPMRAPANKNQKSFKMNVVRNISL